MFLVLKLQNVSNRIKNTNVKPFDTWKKINKIRLKIFIHFKNLDKNISKLETIKNSISHKGLRTKNIFNLNLKNKKF